MEKREPLCTVGGNADFATTVENNVEGPKKLKIELPYDPVIPFSRYISEETPNTHSKEYMHPYAHCNLIYNSHDREATQVPINRRLDKNIVVVHIYNGILLNHKKSEVLPFGTARMGLEGVMLSEMPVRERQYRMISLICGI